MPSRQAQPPPGQKRVRVNDFKQFRRKVMTNETTAWNTLHDFVLKIQPKHFSNASKESKVMKFKVEVNDSSPKQRHKVKLELPTLFGKPFAFGAAKQKLLLAKNSAAKAVVQSAKFAQAVLGDAASQLKTKTNLDNEQAKLIMRLEDKLGRLATEDDLLYVVDDDGVQGQQGKRFVARVDLLCLEGKPSFVGLPDFSHDKAILSAAKQALLDPVLKVLLAKEPRNALGVWVRRLRNRDVPVAARVHGMRFEKKEPRDNPNNQSMSRVELSTCGRLKKLRATGGAAESDTEAKNLAVEALFAREEVQRWFREAVKVQMENTFS